MKKTYILCLFSMLCSMSFYAQKDIEPIVSKFINELSTTSKFDKADLAEWKIIDVSPSINPDVQHVNVQQFYNNTPIALGRLKLTLRNGEITRSHIGFISGIKDKISVTSPTITPEIALNKSFSHHKMERSNFTKNNKSPYKITFENRNFSSRPIIADLEYVKVGETLRLVWSIDILDAKTHVLWKDRIDASTGELVDSKNQSLYCKWDEPETNTETKAFVGPILHEETDSYNSTIFDINNSNTMYTVYAIPEESPLYANFTQTIVGNEQSPLASPCGWHDIAGVTYNTTRGNNTWIGAEDGPDIGYSPPPSDPHNLFFNYFVNASSTALDNQNAAIVNAFYWLNMSHDISYHHGFNELSGNFQQDNFNRGGTGNDDVEVFAQSQLVSSEVVFAQFTPAPEGISPYIHLYEPNVLPPNGDVGFSGLIVAHEYAHGISTRLVGTTNETDFTLHSKEQMGEGWSDWFGLILTIDPNDNGSDLRPVGNYVRNYPINGPGIRLQPYSTDMLNGNTFTYADIQGSWEANEVGFGWATILWDLTWALIDAKGFDTDWYNGTGGNNIAMKMIIESLNETPFDDMNFVTGRDAILAADRNISDDGLGDYQCLIWSVFANRGVGVGANALDNDTLGDQIVSFDVPINLPCTPENCSTTVAPDYQEGFESSMGDWTNSTNDDLDWIRNSGGTPNTGPSGGSNGSTYYMYTPATDAVGIPPILQVAILNSPCIDLTNVNAVTLNFDYYMQGVRNGNRLSLEISNNDGLSWSEIWFKKRPDGQGWFTANVNLSQYSGEEIRLRFKRTNAQNEMSDVAVDNINITQSNYCVVMNPFPSINDPNHLPGYYITNVVMGSINNQSTSNPTHYQDFTNISTVLSREIPNFLQIDWNVNISPAWRTVVAIDWNQDGVFGILNLPQEGPEVIYNNNIIQIPESAIPGPTRMRIYLDTGPLVINDEPISPCGAFFSEPGSIDFWEVEDYTVIVPAARLNTNTKPDADVSDSNDLIDNENIDLSLYPNPVTNGVLNVKGVIGEESTYSVYNLLGQRVSSGQLSHTLNVSALSKGVYIIQIINNSKTIRQRFIVK
ncbi:MAG: T9SS C-terminal target domain-containing protein [Winogradskyella sp.]|uniref:M36 family metallopeptidase n=1 Tax=Winogradskyella sp. TaxID=1883156 RepID=UPI000F41A267|nr:M36 family metallopeptidase [Winogradskyella sp.]RNC84312.1 MAG: T9SS C-terminal target domain-containing protein [Winogradskyella sp.]